MTRVEYRISWEAWRAEQTSSGKWRVVRYGTASGRTYPAWEVLPTPDCGGERQRCEERARAANGLNSPEHITETLGGYYFT